MGFPCLWLGHGMILTRGSHGWRRLIGKTRSFSRAVPEGVVVGYVHEVIPHPDSDRLFLTSVGVSTNSDGKQEEPRRIVCGALNVFKGQFVAVALPGTKLNLPNLESRKAEDLKWKKLKIKASKVLNEDSQGMICSLQELGFKSSKEDGIWVIDTTKVGPQDIGKPIKEEWLNEYETIEQCRRPLELLRDTYWKEMNALRGTLALLSWDEQVMMPSSGKEMRATQKGVVSKLLHEVSTSEEYSALLEEARASSRYCLNEFEKRAVEIEIRALRKSKAVSSQQVAELTSLQSKCFQAWTRARERDDYKIVQGVLHDLLQACKSVARAGRIEEEEHTLYESMLSNYVRGVKEAELDQLFTTLRDRLVPLAQKVQTNSNSPFIQTKGLRDDLSNIDENAQRDLSEYFVNMFGPDVKSRLRLDVSAHPFTISIGNKYDVRITTRYISNNAEEGLSGTVHEMGHALYELGLPDSPLPSAQFLDLAAHESQSLFWERMIGQGRPFWEWITPRVKQNFGYGTHIGEDSCSAETLYYAINRIQPNLIRVQADELHYPLHIIVRFKIEKELVNADLDVKHIPEKWNHLYHEYLGIAPPNDAQGCLQDVHWYSGAFGYFPSYTLGALYANQLYQHAAQTLGGEEELNAQIGRGEFRPILDWLREHVHSHGAIDGTMSQLCRRVTGRPLDPDLYADYLERKYS